MCISPAVQQQVASRNLAHLCQLEGICTFRHVIYWRSPGLGAAAGSCTIFSTTAMLASSAMTPQTVWSCFLCTSMHSHLKAYASEHNICEIINCTGDLCPQVYLIGFIRARGVFQDDSKHSPMRRRLRAQIYKPVRATGAPGPTDLPALHVLGPGRRLIVGGDICPE